MWSAGPCRWAVCCAVQKPKLEEHFTSRLLTVSKSLNLSSASSSCEESCSTASKACASAISCVPTRFSSASSQARMCQAAERMRERKLKPQLSGSGQHPDDVQRPLKYLSQDYQLPLLCKSCCNPCMAAPCSQPLSARVVALLRRVLKGSEACSKPASRTLPYET